MPLYEYEATCRDTDETIHHYDGVFEASWSHEAKAIVGREAGRCAEIRGWNSETVEVTDLRCIPETTETEES